MASQFYRPTDAECDDLTPSEEYGSVWPCICTKYEGGDPEKHSLEVFRPGAVSLQLTGIERGAVKGKCVLDMEDAWL